MNDAEFWRTLARATDAGERLVLATVVGVNGSAPRAAGARMMVWADGRIAGTVGGGNFEHQVIEAAMDALRSGVPRRYSVHLTRDLGMCCGGAMDVFLEPVAATDRLVLFGAGHVAAPTARVAREAGFSVTVVDERDDWNTPERFPECERFTGDPRAFARGLTGDARTYAFVVTHDHSLDQDLVELLMAKPFAWIGLIGSRTKVQRFRLRFRAAGLADELFARVSAPVGLDIGAETPAEIAIAVVGELIRERRHVQRPLALMRNPAPA